MSLVSIIIPTYNRSQTILRAVHSVLNQTYQNFELIIVDDGSSDETEELVKSLDNSIASTRKIIYLKTQNGGVSKARNLGASIARGEWLTFLDSDDEWLPEKLNLQLDFLINNPHQQVAYTQEIWIRNGVRVNPRITHQKYSGQIFDKCVQQCFIAPSSLIIKKSLFSELNGFDEEFVVCEDYDLWLKISSLYEINLINKALIIKHGGHSDQLSTKFVAMDLWRMRALLRILKIRNLSDSHKACVIDSIKQKGEILIKGFHKHGNMDRVSEVESMLQELL
jgi:glycosyltransferase involved in cell wall biosynthesis